MMRLRLAAINDATDIARVQVDSWRATYQDVLPKEHFAKLSYEEKTSMWEKILKNQPSDSHILLMIDDQNNVVGFSSGGRNRQPDSEYDSEIYAIYLGKTFQKRGLGKELFLASIDRLKIAGFQSMMLWVLEKNPACGFYLKMGGKIFDEKLEDIGSQKHKELAIGWQSLLVQPFNNLNKWANSKKPTAVAIGIKREGSTLTEYLSTLSALNFHYKENLTEVLEDPSLLEADILLVSLLQPLSHDILQKFFRLKYIGIYGSNTSNIDLDLCLKRSIKVSPVIHYCDNETAEYILAQFAKHREEVFGTTDFNRLRIGIIGLGAVGKALANIARENGRFHTSYFSHNRNFDKEESLGLQYLPLKDLIRKCDLVSINVPPGTIAIRPKELEFANTPKLIVNTSLGPNIEENSINPFLERTKSKIVFDIAAQRGLSHSTAFSSRLILDENVAWKRLSSQQRLDQIFISNLQKFLRG